MADEKHTWAGFPIVAPGDATSLEVSAAARQFQRGLPEQTAEAAAWGDYRRERALDAAAHHLLGIRAAHAGGWNDEAAAHAAAYKAAAEAAGFDPVGPVPEQVDARARAAMPLMRFQPHPADALWRQPSEPGEPAAAARTESA